MDGVDTVQNCHHENGGRRNPIEIGFPSGRSARWLLILPVVIVLGSRFWPESQVIDPARYERLPIQFRLQSLFDCVLELLGLIERHDGGPANWTWTANNLRCVALALQNHATRQGILPPHQDQVNPGSPPLSWRVAILPYLDQEAIWRRWDRSSAWNSDANGELANFDIPQFARWDSNPFTRCITVTGRGTCWPDGGGMRLEEVGDRPSQTILLIEYPFEDIHWAEPRDLALEQAIELYSQPTLPDIDYLEASGESAVRTFVVVVTVDGSAHRLPLGLPRETLRALFTANGGETIDLSQILSRDH